MVRTLFEGKRMVHMSELLHSTKPAQAHLPSVQRLQWDKIMNIARDKRVSSVFHQLGDQTSICEETVSVILNEASKLTEVVMIMTVAQTIQTDGYDGFHQSLQVNVLVIP